jgi:hypothetical protein
LVDSVESVMMHGLANPKPTELCLRYIEEFQLVADVVNLLSALMEPRVLSINTSGHFAFDVIVAKHESLICIDSANSTVLKFNVRCCGASKNQRFDHRLLRFRVSVLSFL